MSLTEAFLVVLEDQPGHLIRRLHQISVALFLDETQTWGVTAVQFSALTAMARQPGLDQRTLARRIGFDTSTLGSVLDRLEARGLVVRQAHRQDRRVRLLFITPAGQQTVDAMRESVLRAGERLLAPLSPEEQATLLALMRKLVITNNALSRAPAVAGEAPPDTPPSP